MIAALATLIATSPESGADVSTFICDVGRLALRDLPAIDHSKGYDRYYGNADLQSGDLLSACPTLRHEVPSELPLADDKATRSANVHAPPISGERIPLTMLFGVGIPVISPNAKTATVEMGYTCTGLCGARFVAHYIRGPYGWRRDGEIRMTVLS